MIRFFETEPITSSNLEKDAIGFAEEARVLLGDREGKVVGAAITHAFHFQYVVFGKEAHYRKRHVYLDALRYWDNKSSVRWPDTTRPQFLAYEPKEADLMSIPLSVAWQIVLLKWNKSEQIAHFRERLAFEEKQLADNGKFSFQIPF